ncbi:protein of unknown function [Paraburkholderia dioscoreae]|uniref:Uncharacterized protein n=1 Tax=Paraburkholderia dioscoreae TaxID=2604047 RepID=A0A5Q4ZCZ6_9BURK|nr:protein of unknown function [Paraburkholderia dioscoreae]
MVGEESTVVRVPLERLAPVSGRRAAPQGTGPPVDRCTAGETRIAGLGIAVVAAGAHFLATFPWVESVVGPLDVAIRAHATIPPKNGEIR